MSPDRPMYSQVMYCDHQAAVEGPRILVATLTGILVEESLSAGVRLPRSRTPAPGRSATDHSSAEGHRQPDE